MITLGLIGGVASGKSFVAQSFRDLGAYLIDGDQTGHQVLLLHEVAKALRARWGNAVEDPQGGLNRSAIASIVFADTDEGRQELKFLETLTHPRIESQLRAQLARVRELNRHRAIVLDAAVMLKGGWDRLCDQIVFVDAPHELRLKRALLRGLTEAQFRAREASQTPLSEKRKRADLVIDNSGPPQKTHQQVEQVWHSLPQIA